MQRLGLTTVCALGVGGCGSGPIAIADGTESVGDGDGTESVGDGDGTESVGDGDGDGDGDASGDGDGDGALPADGDFLFAVETSLGPDLPLQFIANLDFEYAQNGADWVVDFTLWPLSLDQGSTTQPREIVGSPQVYADISVSDGEFLLDVGMMSITGAANPLTGSDIELTAEFYGGFVDDDAFCGELAGMLTSPLEFDLAGSNFAAIRVMDTSPDGLPVDFPYRCDQLP